MKFLLSLLFLMSTTSYAVPVLNENIAAEGTLITIWPDHKDPNHYYFAPNMMNISKDKNSDPKLHFTEFLSNCNFTRRCSVKGMLNVFFVAGYREDQLRDAQAGILKINPKARFSPIPFLSSKVEFGKVLSTFVDHHDCSPRAGQAADEVPCSLVLNSRGLKTLVPYLREGKIFPFKFFYRISGVLSLGDGSFKDEMLDYATTVNLGGDVLIGHTDLN